MIYILAAIGAVTVAVLLWRAFRPGGSVAAEPRTRPQPVAPDDDPEFLRRLDEQQRDQGKRGEQGTNGDGGGG